MAKTTPKAADDDAIKRVKTGIAGLDEMLCGGLPEGTQSLLMGEAGSGKTLLATHVLYSNAKQGIPCTYVTIDQTEQDLIRNAVSAFPHLKDMKELVNKGMFNIAEKEVHDEFKSRENIMLFIADIIKDIRSNNTKVLAVDSLSIIRALLENDRSFTRTVNYMAENFHNLGVTSLIALETPSSESNRAPGLFEESMFDGVIKLSNITRAGTTQHYASILKMRFTAYKSSATPLEITPDGIKLQNRQSSL